MDFIINVVLYYLLIGIILFGAFVIWRMLPKDRIVNGFVWMLAIFGGFYIADSLNIILSELGYIPMPIEMDYKYILTGATSQLYLQYFVYTLLFSSRTAIKWTIIQTVPILAIVAAKWIGDQIGALSQFTPISYQEEIENLFRNPLFQIRLTIILIQLAYALVILSFAHRLIPLYQGFIERTESNAARNIIWVKEVCYLFLALSAVYTIDVIFNNITTAIVYFTVAIYSFSRLIILMLSNYAGNFNLRGDLYAQIGVKWSLRRMWYIPNDKESMHQTLATEKALFDDIEDWILSTKAYANSSFSFKDVAERFPQLNYNTYDNMLQRFCSCNFQSHVRAIRIEQAIRLMKDDKAHDLQLKNIADEVGFESSSSFSRAFKATKGMTASKWRDNLRGTR